MKKIVLGIFIILSTSSFALTLEKQVEYINKIKSDSFEDRFGNIIAGVPMLMYCNILGSIDTITNGLQDIYFGLIDINLYRADDEKTSLENWSSMIDELKKTKITDFRKQRLAYKKNFGVEGHCTNVLDRWLIDTKIIRKENVESNYDFWVKGS